MSERGRQRLRTITTVVVTALVIAPAAALATHGFSDVDDGDFFHAAVDWMKDNGVTVGCNPAGGNTKYCPDDFVTRGEMAVFLERLDSKDVFLRPGDVSLPDGGGDADTLDGIDSAGFLRSGATAVNSDKLDGQDSTAFLGAGARAVNSDKLDGLDSTALVPGAAVPSGTTLRGGYVMTSSDPDFYWFAHSWPGILNGVLTTHYIDSVDAIPAGCPGTVAAPEAAPGHLCVFERSSGGGLDNVFVVRPTTNSGGTTAYPYGFSLFKDNGSLPGAFAYGTWAVTVP